VRIALAQPVARGAVLVHRREARIDGLLDAADQVALVGEAVEQLGPPAGRELVRVAERTRELLGRLPMGPEQGGALARDRRVAEHCL